MRAVHEAKWMNEMEISIYDSWFDPVVSSLPGLIPDAFIYLRASPDTCHKRMMLRKRAEEGGVSLDYLRGLHEKHESWLFPSQTGNHGVLSVSKLPFHVDCSLPADIRDRVFYLEGEHMHSSIQKVLTFLSFPLPKFNTYVFYFCFTYDFFVILLSRFLLWFSTVSPTLILTRILKQSGSMITSPFNAWLFYVVCLFCMILCLIVAVGITGVKLC